MISKIIFRKIKFHNINFKDFKKYIIKKGLFVFPAGPALANIEKSHRYYESIKKADFVFFDSGLFVLLLKTFKNINVDKFSGYKFLNLFFDYLKENRDKKVFCIDPNSKFSRSNKTFLRKLGIKKIYNYLAPQYNPLDLSDKKLLTLLRKKKPNFVLTNIGGGTQEILGLYLKQKLGFKTTILCTGGAISFFTGDQAPINNFTDKFYLGWLIRLIYNPIVFFKKYVFGLRLIPMVIFNKITIIN